MSVYVHQKVAAHFAHFELHILKECGSCAHTISPSQGRDAKNMSVNVTINQCANDTHFCVQMKTVCKRNI